ncbi:response regulator transcription factor [Paenibacillus cymbidii]|uniref:response regulator transcription factor n=1 Tax=Paenibacillus cymbidii TaxID=1639034 RepID=UPI001080423D|nr:response regulator [Paenibacillus cymbidii]
MLFIFIVDDEKWIRNGIVSRVEECPGFAAAGVAANGEDALKWLESGYADILITDVRMPRMDGLELINIVNERFPWIKSILVSSYDDFEYAKRGISLGTIDYIVKPVRRSDLEGALHTAAERLRTMRTNEAKALLLKFYNAGRPLLSRWQEPPGNRTSHSLPLLVIDTLAMLEGWANERYDLLAPLADEWIARVAAARKAEGVNAWLAEETERSPVPVTSDRRLYFRLTAVFRLELAAAWFNNREAMAGAGSGKRAIHEVKRYVESHYQGKLSLQEIADAVNVSKPYLANVFRQETGTTIWNYLIAVRMRKAKELLLTTNKKLNDIAAEIGYTDSAHFAKVFKAYYGMNTSALKSKFYSTGLEELEE